VKQRLVRKLNEEKGIEHKPVYFYEWFNEADNKVYWRYNEKYFSDKKN
jgi:hypothetical protein